MKEQWDTRLLRCKIKRTEDKYQYYAYVLEAVLVFFNGMVLPLVIPFLENSDELKAIKSYENWKQDYRLSEFLRENQLNF